MPKITLSIIHDTDTGQTQVQGPIANKLACMDLIGVALRQIAAFEPKQIVPATSVPALPKNGESAPHLRIVT